ncbi:MAG: Coq4 family protein [Archangium sp.]
MTETMTLPPELPREASFLRRLFISLKALSVLKDEAANPGLAWLLHTAMDDGTYEQLATTLKAELAGDFASRPTVPGDKTLEELATYPEGTLGQVFSGYFRKNGIFPFTHRFPVQSDADFLYKRYRETHDIHHMITGYAIDEFGEIEIQAFYIGNLGLRHARLIVTFGLPYLFIQQRSVRKVVRRLVAAWKRGKQSRNVLTLPYAEMWNVPISELSARYLAA